MAKEQFSKTAQKYIDILKTGKISESELIALRSFLNNKKPANDERDAILELIDNGIDLSKDQQQKGLDWLMKQYKTPTGKIKNEHPFGSREVSILENAKEVYLNSLPDMGNMFVRSYIPEFAVKDKFGNVFTYVLQGGKLNITG